MVWKCAEGPSSECEEPTLPPAAFNGTPIIPETAIPAGNLSRMRPGGTFPPAASSWKPSDFLCLYRYPGPRHLKFRPFGVLGRLNSWLRSRVTAGSERHPQRDEENNNEFWIPHGR